MYYLANSLYQLDTLIRLLGTPPGVFLAAVIVAMFLFSFGRPGRWVVLTVLLFISTLSFGMEALQNPLITPLQELRFAAEPLVFTFLMFLVLPSFFSRGAPLRTPFLAAALAFWFFEMVYSLHIAISVEAQHGVLAMIIFTVILIVMGFGLPHWIRGLPDVHSLARCMGAVALIFIVGTMAQVAVNRHAIIFANRLFAITGNPQHAAFILAILLLPICVLVASKRETTVMRFVWGATAGADVVMLLWTGSRTGALTALVGIALLFRRRIGTFLGVGVLGAIFVALFLAIFQPDAMSSQRIISTLDTRTGVWSRLLEKFEANPFFGTMSQNDFTAAESSYLTIAAHTGIVGLGLLGVVLWFLPGTLRRLARLRTVLHSEEDLILVDWASAGLLAILVGAFFEGVLLGTLNFMLLSIYFYLGILKFLSDESTIEAATHGPLTALIENEPSYMEQPHEFIDAPSTF
jgi:hypothetical protein